MVSIGKDVSIETIDVFKADIPKNTGEALTESSTNT